MTKKRKKQNKKRTKPQRRNGRWHMRRRGSDAQRSRSQPINVTPRLLQAEEESRAHIAAHDHLPEEIKNALLIAETNCRGNDGSVPAVGYIDGSDQIMRVPHGIEGRDLLMFLKNEMRDAGGQHIHFSFTSQHRWICVIFLCNDHGYLAKAKIERHEDGIVITDWEVSRKFYADDSFQHFTGNEWQELFEQQ